MDRVADFSVLFVCTGNICRSPFGERLLRARLSGRSDIVVASAGVMAVAGHAMDADAEAQLLEYGGDATGFAARQITTAMVNEADLVLTATKQHRQRVLEDAPAALKRTFTILEFADLIQHVDGASGNVPREIVVSAARHRSLSSIPDHDVPDPYRRGHEAHAEAATLIAAAVDRISVVLAL